MNVAWPTIGWSERFSASKNTTVSAPSRSLTFGSTGRNRQGRPGATLLLKNTVIIVFETAAVSFATRRVVPPAPVTWQNRR